MIYNKSKEWNMMKNSDELILINKEQGKTVFLNDSASIIYNLVDGSNFDEIVNKVSEYYHEEEYVLFNDIKEVIEFLLNKNLILLHS